MSQLTFLSAAPPANPSPLPDSGEDSMTLGAASCLPILQSLGVTSLDGLSGKTSPVSCQAGEDGILAPSSGRWGTWGMGGPTGCWTLSGAEWTGSVKPSRRDGDVCSLSDVLETQSVPGRYFLSAKACAGILRRAERRGKVLPGRLKVALEAVVAQTSVCV